MRFNLIFNLSCVKLRLEDRGEKRDDRFGVKALKEAFFNKISHFSLPLRFTQLELFIY